MAQRCEENKKKERLVQINPAPESHGDHFMGFCGYFSICDNTMHVEFFMHHDMKIQVAKILFIALLPILFAFQCEEEPEMIDFATDYVIQNNSGIDLMLLFESNYFVEIGSQSEMTLTTDFNSAADPILPSATASFGGIKLYKQVDDDFILAYEQDPIDDDLWVYSEPIADRYEFRLTITSEMID